MSSIKLTHIYQPSANDIGETLYQFLNFLSGPTVIHIKGQDSSRCRVIVTLLHGNEPSGLKAIYQLITSRFIPEVDCKFIIASVVAARTEPVFKYRMLPGQLDLNRCFNSEALDLQSMLAGAIKETVKECRAEAIIDLHNTSGSGPAFSVSIDNSDKHLALASHFTHRMVFTDLRLGSIMEQNFDAPIITVEAGGAQDDEADVTALEGIKSFLLASNVFKLKQHIQQLHSPRRLELTTDNTIAYASSFVDGTNVTMRQDIERLNFLTVAEGEHLGWLPSKSLKAFKLDNAESEVSDYFMVEGIEDGKHRLLTKCSLTLIMVTTRADIASSDCLFYFVKENS